MSSLIINKNKLENFILSIILFILTLPYGSYIFWGRKIDDFLKSYCIVIVFILTVIMVLKKNTNLKRYKISFIILLFRLYLLFISIVISGDKSVIVQNIKITMQIFSLCILCDYYFSKNNIEKFLKVILKIFIMYISIDIYIQIFFREGIRNSLIYTTDGMASRNVQYLFMGYKNYYGFNLIPIMVISALNKEIDNKSNYVNNLLLILITISIVLCKSSTSILTLCIFLSSYFLVKYSKKLLKLSVTKIISIYGILFFLIIVFNKLEPIVSQISLMFGKGTGFTGRTKIWQLALHMIKEKWLLGYGEESIIIMDGYFWYSHNQILDLFIQGGIIAVILFLAIIIISYKNIKNNSDSTINQIILIGLFSCTVLMFTESIVNTSIVFYMLFNIAYRSCEIQDSGVIKK